MYKNRTITLFAFASTDLKKSSQRLEKQALESKYYDDIQILSPNDFDDQMKSKFLSFKKDEKKRGYGYWFWKPLFLLKTIESLKQNDIVHYVDIGCHIQNKNNRFKEYLDILLKDNNWILPFQYHSDNFDFNEEILLPNRDEYKYTKADLFEYFDFLDNKEITHSPQFWAGSFFLVNSLKSKNFLKEWVKVFETRFDLINDKNSVNKNFDGFIQNRHDQSVFSLLCKKNSIQALSAYECEWVEKNNSRSWEHNLNNPILARRDLKFGIFKRFLNRQIKTFKRYKKKILSI